MCLTGNSHPYRQWIYDSPGMHMLTGNIHSLYRVLDKCKVPNYSFRFHCRMKVKATVKSYQFRQVPVKIDVNFVEI